MSTSVGIQYIGGYHELMWEEEMTLRGYHDSCGEYLE